MDDESGSKATAGGAIFARLKALGIEYVFANSGTDFPPIIEGLAEAAAASIALPRALIIPHEHAAMGMAYGYTAITGKAQAVMLHTNVGLSNGVTGAINAACEHVPMLLMSGRTPTMEAGRTGARTVPIGWGQEMRDQAALVRESTKWDYELRYPEQIAEILDRAYALANSTPKGPVYLSLPREVLCEEVDIADLAAPPAIAPAVGAPDPAAVSAAAGLLAAAKAPLIIAQRGAGDEASFSAFDRWVDEWGIAVSSWWATRLAISTEHPCHIGADPGPWLAEADVVVILDSLAPWWPDRHQLAPGARVINIGPDPLFSRFPVRNFPSAVSVVGENAITLPQLISAMRVLKRNDAAIDARRQRLASDSRRILARARDPARTGSARGITKAFASLALGEALEGHRSSVFSELGAELGVLKRERHSSWFQEPHSGGLGWSFPAALGAALADPDRLCVATMGDGSYMFANPTVCHQIAEAVGLPILVMILNNGEWGAVRQSVTGLYPDGHAAKANQMPLTSLKPSPDFTLTARASRAWAREVARTEELRGAIDEAIEVVRAERRLALLNVQVLPD